MEHHHHHHPAPDLQKLNRSFIIGIVLNVLFVVAEAEPVSTTIRWLCSPTPVTT